MKKYETLIKILDELKKEAPSNFKSYYKNDKESITAIRAKCYIHLYLKVNFGILDFLEREKYITDGPGDGGIDAYFIDKDEKIVYYIQSKFRNTKKNYTEKDILYTELLSMDISRIIKDGEDKDENGNKYNGKILKMQEVISNQTDPFYDSKIIILANTNKKEKRNIKRAIGGWDFILFDHEKSYTELVFPMITSTFYKKEKLIIKINVDGSSSNRAKSNIKTSYKDCTITMLLVPVEEIGRIMSMYKNSILKYNPRSFLSLDNNDVNKNIESTIKNIESNDFALFNNGVTMLASEALYSDSTAKKGVDQLLLTNPQIINGGQTAYTLSRIYEECKEKNNFSVLNNKSVVLKIFTLEVSPDEKLGLELIEKISKATNFQTKVDIEDRISNNEKQIKLQKIFFEKYGYYYERKRGEYSEGLNKKYIEKKLIIDKAEFMRVFISSIGFPNLPKRASSKVLFSSKNLDKIEISQIPKYFYAFKIFELIKEIKNKNEYGNSLKYGNYALIYATILNSNNLSLDSLEINLYNVLNKWNDFEKWIRSRKNNYKYFEETIDNEKIVLVMNYSGYYRGTTLNEDLKTFFTTIEI